MKLIRQIIESPRQAFSGFLGQQPFEQGRAEHEWPIWAHWLTLLVLFGGGICVTVLFRYITYDDVFLAFRYARNVLSGYGFVYNPGERFLGTPAPFFVGLLVLGKTMFPGLPIPEIGGVISGAALLGCSVFVYLLGKEYNQPIVGALGALLTLLSPFTVMALGGETSIYLMLICAAFYVHARGHHILSAILLGLAVLNRSEGIVAAGVIFGHLLLIQRRVLLRVSATFALTVLPWAIYATVRFGSPLTHSLEAKIAQRAIGLPPFTPAAAYWIRHVIYFDSPWILALVPLVGLGGIGLLGRYRRWWAFFAWIASQSLGYLVLDVPFYHWYVAHWGIGLAVLVGLGFCWSISTLGKVKSRFVRGTLIPLVVLLVGATTLLSGWGVRRYWQGEPNPANRLYAKTGHWLHKHTPPGSSVAYIEIGQIGYYSERQIVDLLGLVSPGVAKRLKKGNFLWAYQFYQPDYVIYNPLFASWMDPVVVQPWFKAAYEKLGEIDEPGYPFPLTIYRMVNKAAIPAPVEVDVAQLRFEKPIKLHRNVELEQTFEMLSPNLCGVEVLFATFGHKSRWPVVVHLRSLSNPEHDLVCQEIPASVIRDNTWYGIFFPPIADSEGQSYQIYFEAPEVPIEEPLALWASKEDAYPAGIMEIDGYPGEGDMAFKAYVCPSR